MKILLLAIRTLLRFRLYTLINIVGLALSLGSCILIFRYVHDQWMTDHFIPELDRVCVTVMEDEGTRQIRLTGITPANGGNEDDLLQNAAVERYAIYYEIENDQITVNNKLCKAATVAADTNYLKIIPFPIIQTATDHLLERPDEAAITASYAQLIFGKKNPVGKEIVLSCGKTVTIKAVLGEPQIRFSMPFDLLFSYQITNYAKILRPQTLVRLYKGNTANQLNRQYSKFKQIYSDSNRTRFQLLPLGKFYFNKSINDISRKWPKGNRTHLLILSAIAFLLLVVGLFNFINIYTVVVMKRAREFGMKKVFGANRRQVATQLFMENLFMTAFALLLAWAFVEIGGLAANAWMRLPIPPNARFDCGISIFFLLVLPFVTSVYPYIQYNYTSPLRSIRSIGRSGNSVVSRNIFLTIQYTLTITLVILSMFSIRQLNYMLDSDPGFKTDNIIMAPAISAPIGDNMNLWDIYNNTNRRIENALKTSPLFTNYCFNRGPLGMQDYNTEVHLSGREKIKTRISASSESYFKMLGIRLKEGRMWNDSIDSYRDFQVIINETARKQLGITSIENATLITNSYLVYYTGMKEGRKPEYKIIGVVEDFATGHLSGATPPIVFFHFTSGIQVGLMAEIVPGRTQEAIRFLQEQYDQVSGDGFRYTFLKDDIRAIYDADKQLVQIASFFAIIAILISSMGLFSLSLFDVQQRFHEISIRKVNGATTEEVLRILLRKYYRLLGISFLIAVPSAWLMITGYLRDFAHKASVAWWIFALALLITICISFITLIYQTQKAARTNPAVIIRSE